MTHLSYQSLCQRSLLKCDIMSLTIQQTIIIVSVKMRTSTTIKQPIAIPIASQNESDPVIQTRQNYIDHELLILNWSHWFTKLHVLGRQ